MGAEDLELQDMRAVPVCRTVAAAVGLAGSSNASVRDNRRGFRAWSQDGH